MTDRPRVSKWVVALARWAILFGLIGVGVVVSTWFYDESATSSGKDAWRLLGTGFLALAFVLAPFVRNAFGLPSFSGRQSRGRNRTTLDELREGTEGGTENDVPPAAPKLTMFARVVIALYAVYAIVLVSALLSMS